MSKEYKKPMGKNSRIKSAESPEEIDALVASVIDNEAKYTLAAPGYVAKLKRSATRRKKALKPA